MIKVEVSENSALFLYKKIYLGENMLISVNYT